MAFTSVQLCNIALLRVGGTRISSLNDQSENAIIANIVYDIVYENVLAKYKWQCSTLRVKLAQLNDSPVYEFNYQYQLPTSPKCLRIFSIYPKADYKVENGKLLCNLNEVYIRYAARITEAELSAHVALVISARLAIEFANRIAQDSGLKAQLWSEYRMFEREAKDIDGIGSEQDEEGEESWINAGWGSEDEDNDEHLE